VLVLAYSLNPRKRFVLALVTSGLHLPQI